MLRLLAASQTGIDCHYFARQAGTAVAEVFPNLRGRVSEVPTREIATSIATSYFLTLAALPCSQARTLLDAGVRVIDLAADFRIKDVSSWEKWYGMQHASPELVAEAVYGT